MSQGILSLSVKELNGKAYFLRDSGEQILIELLWILSIKVTISEK